MNLHPVAADRSYTRLKADLMRGRFPPATVLNVHMLAQELGVSISPVRDALGRLVGERLVLVRIEGGFQTPPMTEDIARDLYLWHAKLVRTAIRDRGFTVHCEHPPPDLAGIDASNGMAIVRATAELFDYVGRCSGSEENWSAIAASGDMLAPLRTNETFLTGRTAELEAISSCLLYGGPTRLQDLVDRYHRRRLRRLDAIVAALFRPKEPMR